jgi:hypothetical protein
MIFCPKRPLRTEDGDDILDGLLPEAASVFFLDVNHPEYNGALCRIVQPVLERNGRVAVQLIVEKTQILVPHKAVMRGLTRDTQLALGIKVMLPLIITETSSRSETVALKLDKASFDAHMTALIDDIVPSIAQSPATSVAYKVKMEATLARLPHRLKTDLFIVCGTIANIELFKRLDAKADSKIVAFTARNATNEHTPTQ